MSTIKNPILEFKVTRVDENNIFGVDMYTGDGRTFLNSEQDFEILSNIENAWSGLNSPECIMLHVATDKPAHIVAFDKRSSPISKGRALSQSEINENPPAG